MASRKELWNDKKGERGTVREANGIMIYFLHSASKIHGSEEHSSEASIRTKRNLKMQDFEFTSHQIISTTVLMRFWHKPETSIHSQKEEKKKKQHLTYSSIFPQDVFSGTEVWNQHLGFINPSKLSEYLPANKSTYPWLLELIVLSSEANPT